MTNGKGRNNDCESGENWKEPVRVNGINVTYITSDTLL